MFNLQWTCWLNSRRKWYIKTGCATRPTLIWGEQEVFREQFSLGILSYNPEETQLQEVTLCNIIKVVSAPDLWKLVDTGNDSNRWDHMVRRSVWTRLLVFQPEKLVAAFLTANTSHTLLIHPLKCHAENMNGGEHIKVFYEGRLWMQLQHTWVQPKFAYTDLDVLVSPTRSSHTNCHKQNESLHRNSLSHTGILKQII